MKYLLLFIFLSFSVHCIAQDMSYEKELSDAVRYFNKIDKEEQFEIAFKKFERLSNAHPKEWLAPYYAAILKSKMCISKMDNPDVLADEALYWIGKCKTIQVNDEILCAESMANTAKMSVHPSFRWLKYEDRIKHPLQLAKKINPSNPRIYVLEANLEFKMPGIFGGGCKKALSIARKAEKLLTEQGVRANNLPHWGMQSIQVLYKSCPL